MLVSDPTIVLIFGPFDPTGASSLPADAVTCAALECHAASALTATLVRDSVNTEDIQPANPELLNDQARCILEDMAVKAIKVGPLYTTETVSVVAQIAADYSNLPLVLHPGRIPYESLADDIDAEDAQLALFELLLPQTDIVVTNAALLDYWLAQGLLPDAPAESPLQGLLNHGANWVLSCNTTIRPGQTGHVLQGRDQQSRTWTDTSAPTGLLDGEGPLACAITAQLAQGHDLTLAVEQALQLSWPLTQRHFQPGMGQRLINRTHGTLS